MCDYKPELTAALCQYLQRMEPVAAIWEGGSAATGFEDEYSDLDLIIATKSKAGDEIFAALDEYLGCKHGIKRRFRIPEPSWHGMSQCLYQLNDSPELFYCDICVVEKSNPHKLTEQDRHGIAKIHYDPEGILKNCTSSPEELEEIAQRVWNTATSIDFVFEIELQKALARGILIDSISLYNIFLQRCLIPLLNLKYRAHKADFAMRYIHRDYPADILKEVEDFLNLEGGVAMHAPRLLQLYQNTKSELAHRFCGH